MDCKKDNALWNKELAEKTLSRKNLGAAKLFAMKAQSLYPNIDGLSELLATIEVYLAAEKTVGTEVDWYAILGAKPLDDDEMIRKRYRKMAIKLHPDKNKTAGADGAFKLLSQAWTVLSDKDKRATFDAKYRMWKAFKGLPFPGGIPPILACENSLFNTANLCGRPPVTASQNGLFNTANLDGRPPVPAGQNGLFNTNIQDRDHMSAAHNDPTPSPDLESRTFWTVCNSCGIYYEYLATYKNHNIACNSCKNPFFASEVPAPSKYRIISSTSRSSQMKQHIFNSTGLDRNSHVSSRTPMSSVNSSLGSSPFSMPGGISSVLSSVSTASGSLDLFTRMSTTNLKRKHEDSAHVMREEMHFGKTNAVERIVAGSAFQPSLKKRCTGGEHTVDSDRRDMETEMASKKGINLTNVFVPQKNSFDAGKVSAPGNFRRNGIRDIPQQQMKNILVAKAQKVIRSKLDEWKESSRKLEEWKDIRKKLDERYPSSISKNTDVEVTVKDKEKVVNVVKLGTKEFVDSETNDNIVSADSEAIESHSMSVPDPDFHDFDGDRVEDTFGENQVWAAYDDEDGMPRYYAFIHSVISKNPFRMNISWLNSKTNDELAPIKWVSSGFPKTTGDLRLGKRLIYSTLNSFSHRVNWTKGSRGLIHIYPRKKDVWALYRNWSLDWDEFTEDDVIHQYDMVEVLEDYSEEHGVMVAPLIKVAGFKTVFCQNADPRKVKNIPKEEMFRFSHQVPSHLLTGKEGENAPKGFLELDPASTPMELLQLITKEEDFVKDVSTMDVAKVQAGRVWPENLLVYKRRNIKQQREQQSG